MADRELKERDTKQDDRAQDRTPDDHRARLMRSLREDIARLEGRLSADRMLVGAPASDLDADLRRGRYRFGVEALDQSFSEGFMPLHALHDMISPAREAGLSAGFLIGILTGALQHLEGFVLWINTGESLRETGGLYGPGLMQFGLSPSRMLFAEAQKAEDALWAAEEAFSVPEIAAIVVDMRSGARALSLTSSRRLHLRAEAHKTPIFLLLSGDDQAADETVALTRWRVAPAPAGTFQGFNEGIGHPAFDVALTRNRVGHTGRFPLLWDSVQHSFHLSHHQEYSHDDSNRHEAHSGAVVSLSFDRPTGTG